MVPTRKELYTGLTVLIIQKQDQRSGQTTQGEIKDILTSSPIHSRGIKVRLQSGEIGRVQDICESKDN